MIQGFFNTVQQDLIRISEYAKTDKHTEDQRRRVHRAAVRMVAVLGMATAVVLGATAFTAITPAGAIFKLATAIALYAVSHDVFVICMNSDKGIIDQVAAVGRGIVADIGDWLNGKKDEGDALRHPITEGTFFRPLWDVVFAQAEEKG